MKKAIHDVFGFDEINRLSKAASAAAKKSSRKSSSKKKKSSKKSTKKSSGKSSSKKSQLTALQILQKWLKNAKKCADQLLKPLKQIWSLKNTKLLASLQKLRKAAQNLSSVISSGLQWGFRNVLKPLAEWVIGDAAPAAVNALAAAFDLVSSALGLFAPIGQAVWDNFLKPLAEWSGDAIVAVLNSLGDAFSFLAQQFHILSDGLADGDSVWSLLAQITENIGTALVKGVFSAFEHIGENLTDWFQRFIADPLKKLPALAVIIQAALSHSPAELWQNFLEDWGNNKIVQAAVKLIKDGWDTIQNFVGNAVSAAVHLAKDGWKNLSDFVGDAISVGVKLTKSGWKAVADFIGDTVSVAVRLAKNGWSSLKNFVGDSISAAVRLTKNGWSSLKNFVGDSISAAVKLTKNGWSSLSNWIGNSKALSVSIKLVKSGWKSVKSWLGNLTAKFNLKLPKVSVTWSGSPIKLPHFSLKWNAKGGILNGAQLFGMAGNTLLGGGEAGREAVLPLERNTGWMDDLADRLANRIAGASSAPSQPIVVQMVLDGRVIATKTIDYINSTAKRTGVNPLSAYL